MRCCRAQCTKRAKYQVGQEFLCGNHCPIQSRNHSNRIPGGSSGHFMDDMNSPFSNTTAGSDCDSECTVSGFTTTSTFAARKYNYNNDMSSLRVPAGDALGPPTDPNRQPEPCPRCTAALAIQKKESECQTDPFVVHVPAPASPEARRETQPAFSPGVVRQERKRNFLATGAAILMFIAFGILIGRASVGG
jgi:hypothetical protein